MKLEQKIIHQYKNLYPNETLKSTSLRTGIQITRVFRLLNGKSMKVSELEIFQSLIDKKKEEIPHLRKVESLVEGSIGLLSTQQMRKIYLYIDRKFITEKQKRSLKFNNYSQKEIA